MESIAQLNFYEGEIIKIYDFELEDSEYFKAKIYIYADWFNSTIKFSASVEHLKKFIDELSSIFKNNTDKATFISELSNVWFKITFDKVDGTCTLEGDISKLINSSKIIIDFKSDYYSVEQFKKSLESIYKLYLTTS